ncbi:uncharacterized protein GGS22DRAFT_200122 [Annulohypoxylon maeteangense]|uniref:uncharacterized protein n=1 Tax=Annulohypoxylon maeteangense TaxID=1927788 RepID=UPI002007718B|nr:uncharacterized protein GGS22DRAFT_200122 [Annulohypoxylon maeteangense]KAI0885030.1 hypothetical protein GGS22DRAFT_200122 [Annulohypoxylon maeteangense]
MLQVIYMMGDQQAHGQDGSLASAIEETGLKAFQPSGDEASRLEGQREFSALLSRTKTIALMSALTKLTQPDRVPPWLRIHLMDVLTLLPQRPDGVRAALEFVFSVHPTSTVRVTEAATPQKRGANITMEALKLASNLLSAPPATVAPDQWYAGIAPQLLSLLDGKEGPDLVKAAAYVIGFGVLGRKQLGAPGTSGWKAFAEPLLTKINPGLSRESKNETLVFSAGPDEVIDLRKDIVLVEADELHIALRRLSSLLDSHPNPGLTKRLLAPLTSSLWTLATWAPAPKEFDDRYRHPADTLLRIYLKLAGSPEKFQAILGNLLTNGSEDASKPRWVYDLVGDSNLQVKRPRDANTVGLVSNLGLLEPKSDAFVELLQSVGTDSDISTLFLNLLRSSLGSTETTLDIKILAEDESTKDPTAQLIEAKVLQKMMERETMSEKLVTGWKQSLELVSQFLDRSQASSTATNDDTTALALSLLNLVVTAPGFQKSNVPADILESIEDSLERISRSQDADVSHTARNLSLLLKYRDALDDSSEQIMAPTDRQIEDRKTYNLAISYITQADSPPPVRTEGLNLLSGLLRANSPILDIQATLVLLSSLLNEDDDYINLTVVRLFAQLANKHPRSTLKEILDHYVDANELEQTDTRLRFGEALLQVIQRLGETFSGEPANQAAEALLSIAGRRAHRPKTKAKQERADRLQQMRNKAARDAWQGEVPSLADLDSDEENEDEEQKARNEIISQIVSGWDSKRGAEDIRMRASALSIFSVCIETNISGLSPPLIEGAVDLCLAALTLETGPETGILRRAAIILIHHVIKALAEAREGGRRLGFALAEASREQVAQTLGYVAQMDGDGLVRQHARDVVEGLRNWRLGALVPAVSEMRGGGDGFTRLVGLDVAKPGLPALEMGVRPKIEEIE